MSQFPAMPMWWADFFVKTDHLTNTEQWAYLKLMAKTWVRNCKPFPDNPRDLARLLGMSVGRWLKIRPRLAPFFDLTDGTWRQKRLEQEFFFVQKKRSQRVEIGKLGGRPVSNKTNGIEKPKGLSNGKQTESTHTHISSSLRSEDLSTANAVSSKRNGFDPQPMLAIFAQECSPPLPAPSKLTPARKTACRARYADLGSDLEAWRTLCRRVRTSPFLTGTNGHDWRADFDWLIKQTNFVKVCEGKYDPLPALLGDQDVIRPTRPPPSAREAWAVDDPLSEYPH